MSDEVIHDFVRRLIRAWTRTTWRKRLSASDFEAAGYRLVTGGQEGHGITRFYDFRTGEKLAEMQDADYKWFEWPVDWAHVDSLAPREFRTDWVVRNGLPSSLVDALVERVLNHLEDARDWVRSKPDDGWHYRPWRVPLCMHGAGNHSMGARSLDISTALAESSIRRIMGSPIAPPSTSGSQTP